MKIVKLAEKISPRKNWSENGSKIVQVGKSVENFGINKTIEKIIAQNFNWNIGGKKWSSWMKKLEVGKLVWKLKLENGLEKF